MKKKVFSLMMTLLLAFMGVAKADVVTIGDGTSTTGYVPMYYLYDNSLSTQLFTAAELNAAGAVAGQMTNIAWYSESTYGYNIQNITIWAANVTSTAATATSPLGSGMTQVFQGNFQEVVGWNVFTLNGNFSWDGTSNILVMVQMNNGNWGSSIQWAYHTTSFTSSSYAYRDGTGYNAGAETYSMSTSSNRANTQIDITPGGGGEGGEEVVVEIGDGTTTYYYYPVNMYFNYSLTEQIYTADEIGTAGSITAISFYYDYTSSFSMDNVTLYMKNVTRDAFASSSDMEPLALGDIVWTGTLSASAAGWVTITLDTPFAYDGTSNLLVAAFDGTSGYPGSSYKFRTTLYDSYRGINWYSDSYTPDPYNTASGFSGSKNYTQYRNNIQLSITTAGGDTPEVEPGLHTFATYGVGDEVEEMIDLLYIERPNGAWMEPYHFQLYNDDDHDVEVVYIDFLHNNGYFSMDEETTEYPFTVAHNGLAGAVDLYINTNIEWNDTEEINSLLAVNTDERSTHLFQIIAAPYEPYCPDVVEKAYPIGALTTGQTWRRYASQMWNEANQSAPYDLHANYDLPDFEENIPDGYDAVMSFTVDHDVMLNAYVNDGENGKVVLYRSDFAGEAGPMADNYYEARPFHNVPSGGGGASGELTVHDGTVTSYYVPAYVAYFDDFARSQCVYPAPELAAMAGSNINTIKWYTNDYNIPYTTVTNVNVYLTEVNEPSISAYVPMSSCQVVYTGTLEFVAAGDGGECTINLNTPYHYNGGNLLIGTENTTDAGYRFMYFLGETINGASIAGSNGTSAANIPATQRNFLPKTTFVYGGRGNRDAFTYGFENGLEGWTVIDVNADGGTWVHSNNNPGGYIDPSDTPYYPDLAHGGTGFAMCYSYIDYDGAYNTDSYLVSPQQYNIDANSSITFWADNANDTYPENFSVCVSTAANPTASSFTQVWGGGAKVRNNANAEVRHSSNRYENWRSHTVNLGAYAGQSVWIAFHDVNYDAYEIWIDDVTVNAASGTPTPPTPVDPDQPVNPTPDGFSAGPVIENLNVLAGTYYLLASSTDPDFEVVINAEELPCPIEAVTNIYPADNALDIPATNLTLLWTLNDYCNEWRLVFSSTYYPEDDTATNHPALIVTDWSSDLQQSFNISAALAANGEQLWENTNYFWRIEQRSNPGTDHECYTQGPVFGFTTSFDVPANLQVNGAPNVNIFETEEDVTLTWSRIYDRNRDNRTFRRYRIYWNGVLYDETTDNNVNEVTYTIPNSEFHYNMVPRNPEEFNVTAVYDEGESPMSNTATVHVSGYGTISGTVYEQDETTPIGGVTVVVTGTNEFEGAEEYTFTTNAEGYYEGQVHVGTYTNAMAYMDGYQEIQTIHPLPFNVVYQQTTPNVDFVMDETFYYPAHVCAHTVYVPGVVGDTLVQVWWEGWASDGGGFVPGGSFEAQIGEGTSTTGYFPFYSLYNYGVHTTLYKAEELMAAGVTGAPMTSLSWYATNSIDESQTGITIWMANVTDAEVSATSPLASGMTKVYTGSLNQPTPTGWVEFTFNEGTFSWDGQSNILILCQRNCGDWTSSIQWQAGSVDFNAMGYVYQDSNPYNVETTTYALSRSMNRPNIIMKAGGREVAEDMTRALHHFNIYRTDCYNDGPYNSENTTFLASVWRPDTSYFDVHWPEAPVGVYKYGVSAVYSGNQADNPNNPRVDYPFEARESEIMWSDACGPCIDKDMQTDITVNVVCNSADSPEGCVVSFTNLNEGEQFNHPQPSITLDASGFQAITPFRKGNYLVTVYLPGYELLQVEESIWGHRDLRYVLTEIIYGVKNLYVSRTGWAMWDPETWEDFPIPEGAIVGPSIIDFETGDFSQFAFDNNGTYPWTVAHEGQDGSYCMKSGNGGVASSTSTISATVNYTMDGTISFDYKSQGEGTSYDVSKFMIDGVQQFSYGAVGTWNNFTTSVAAGEHTFTWSYTKDSSVNPTGDCFLVDNINFNIGGSRAVAEERHLEGYKIMCTSLDDEPIFNHNTPVDQPFCQLTTVDPWSGQPTLIEGERYKVKVATIYSTGQSPWSEAVIWQYEPCDHWGPVDEVTAGTMPQGNHIEWVFDHGHNQWFDPNDPGQGGEASSFSVNFDEGMPEGWTTIDANNDNYNWVLGSEIGGIYLVAGASLAGSGHNESEDMICSGSYSNVTNQAITPDNYLVSPQVNLVAGSTFSFWACGQDASYVAEHFGVFVSDNGTSDWTMVNEWTMTAKSGGNGAMSIGRNGETRVQGTWHNYTVDLSAFAGQKYIAIRHFNCNDQFILNVDDIELTAGAKGGQNFVLGGAFYTQYAEDGVILNFMALDNVYLRSYLLYSIRKDGRFSMTAESEFGKFILTPAYDMDNFMEVFEDFYQNAEADFALLSKMDITEQSSVWKSSVAAIDYQSIMMDVLTATSRTENDHCINSMPFCTTEMIEFPAAHEGGATADENANFGCVSSQPYPSWYHMRINTAGQFVIHMEAHDPDNPTANRDIDYCIWGPFDDPYEPCLNDLTCDKIVDCSYSTASVEDVYLGYPVEQHTSHHNSSLADGTCINYHVPQVGEYYILMITNFSQQQCNISFTKTEGEGETDCEIVNPTNIIGFLITLDGEYLTIVGPDEREFTHDGEFGDHEYCVRPIYPGPAILSDTNYYFSMGCPVCASTNGEAICDAGNPIYAEVNSTDDQVHLFWGEQPEPPTPGEGTTFVYDFENSSMEGLTTIDADGDGYNWVLGSAIGGVYLAAGASLAGSGHNASNDLICSGSFSNATGQAITPNNFLVFPQSSIVAGSTFSFWACGQDASYVAEHFGVAVSTTGNTSATDFTTIAEWTMTAKSAKAANAVRDGRAQGNWYQYTVDLSDYAGMDVYIAIRHFNCTDMFILDIDDVELSIAAKGNRDGIIGYNIYRSTDNVDYVLIATVDGDVTEYFDAPGAGTYYYQVTALYDGCESDPAISGENPDQNYVMVGVTGVGENSDNVNLFPNPTKGNVTIQAMNMHRITVVSVLGQVVFDTELDQDEYILNMAKFNTGMYMVRVYTDEGVTVKRVTVLH